MRNKLAIWTLALLAIVVTSCLENSDGPTVTPPSWKGFNYVVKQQAENGNPGDTVQVERGALRPGSPIRIYAVRKNKGTYVGEISGKIYVRCTLYPEKGAPITQQLDDHVISLANATYDGWEDPYATFVLPSIDTPYTYYKVEVACQFQFKAFGNQNSYVDYSDQTSHEEPYLGHIYTDYVKMHPMNGGSADSGSEGGELKYHTIYTYTQD